MAAAARTDHDVETVLEALRTSYGAKHPGAEIDVYRYNPASIRVRIIDRDFDGKSIVQREKSVEPALSKLPEAIANNITLLLLITPSQRDASLLSLEFDDPSRSML